MLFRENQPRAPKLLYCRPCHHKSCSFQENANHVVAMSVPASTFCLFSLPIWTNSDFKVVEIKFLSFSNICWWTFIFPSWKTLKLLLGMPATIVRSSFFHLFQCHFAFLTVYFWSGSPNILTTFMLLYIIKTHRWTNTIEYLPTVLPWGVFFLSDCFLHEESKRKLF